MKLFLENLNSDPYPPYSINTYTYKVTIECMMITKIVLLPLLLSFWTWGD